jgi:hypothetical protein
VVTPPHRPPPYCAAPTNSLWPRLKVLKLKSNTSYKKEHSRCRRVNPVKAGSPVVRHTVSTTSSCQSVSHGSSTTAVTGGRSATKTSADVDGARRGRVVSARVCVQRQSRVSEDAASRLIVAFQIKPVLKTLVIQPRSAFKKILHTHGSPTARANEFGTATRVVKNAKKIANR